MNITSEILCLFLVFGFILQLSRKVLIPGCYPVKERRRTAGNCPGNFLRTPGCDNLKEGWSRVWIPNVLRTVRPDIRTISFGRSGDEKSPDEGWIEGGVMARGRWWGWDLR